MNNKFIEHITVNEQLLALILRANFKDEGIKFLTSPDLSQQLAYMNRPQGYIIEPHIHNKIPREIHYTMEVLLIKCGKVKVDFYDDFKNYLESRTLFTGDIILLSSGGHGFEMLESSEIIEIKQGPYAGEIDKTRFKSLITSKQ